MKYIAAAFLGLGLVATPLAASATGGVWCDAKDANIDFHFKASSSRDGTGGWWGIEGSFKTSVKTLPKHVAKFDLKDENITERWWDGDSVRLVVQKYESEPFAAVHLSLIANTVEEAVYRGKYDLRFTDKDGAYLHKSGTVECSAD